MKKTFLSFKNHYFGFAICELNQITIEILMTVIKVFFFFFLQGIIRTALPNMNRENREQYQVVIQAKDMGGQMGGLSGTTTVNITLTDVNDNPPRFPQSKLSLTAFLQGKSFRVKKQKKKKQLSFISFKTD